MLDWPKFALERIGLGEDAALITLLAVEGSTPRGAGTKMLVSPAACWGTIGGGNLELQATLQARRMLALEDGPRLVVQDYPLGPLLAQCCGGRVRLMIERIGRADMAWLAEAAALQAAEQPFEICSRVAPDGFIKSVRPAPAHGGEPLTVNGRRASARGAMPILGDELVEPSAPARPVVVMFGAGHVGAALAGVLALLPFRLRWYDSRADVEAHSGLTVEPPAALAGIAREPADFMLILTHDHTLDYALVSAALSGGGQGYLGLIGSKTKRARFASRLRAEGFAADAIARIVCPIGLPGLRDKTPEVIAVSVAADLLIRLQARQALAAPELALASL